MDHPFYSSVFNGSKSNNPPEYNRNSADDLEKKSSVGRLDIEPDSAYNTYEMENSDGTYEMHPRSGRSSNESAGAISKRSKFIPKVNNCQSEDAEKQMKIGYNSKQYTSELSGHTINHASDKETYSSSNLMKNQASCKTFNDTNSSGAIRKSIASPSVNYLVHSISPLKKRQSDALGTEQAVLEQSPKSRSSSNDCLPSLSSLQLSGEGAVGGKISSMQSSSTSYLSQSYAESKIAEPYSLSVSNSNNHLFVNSSVSDRYPKEQNSSDSLSSCSPSNNKPKFQRHLFSSGVASSEASNPNRNMLSLQSDGSPDNQNEIQPIRSRSQASGAINNTKDSPNLFENSSQSNSTSENESQMMRPPVIVPKGGPVYNWQATLNSVSERFAFLFNNEILSDVQFVVGRGEEEQSIPAHKFVLAVGSAVFDAMFNGLLASEQQVIHLPDVEPQAFLTLLSFLYSDEVHIGPETVMTVLYTAKKYAVPALERRCVDFLKTNLSPDNAFMLLTQARLFDEPQLAAMCLKTIDKSTAEAIVAEGFTDIDYDTLILVLQRDTLRIKELDLYHAVCRWAEAQCNRQGYVVTGRQQRAVLGQALKLIRFPLMTVEEFAQGAAQSNILTDAEIVQLFLYFSVNPKPSVDFIDVPRCCMTGKEQSVCRFPSIEARWGYSGTPDRIRFFVDRRIFVIGFGMYGSIHGPSEYDVTIQLIHTLSGKVCGTNETVFTSDGTPHTFRVMFADPIEVLPDTNYTAYATLRGPDSHYGTKGYRKAVVECPSGERVCFSFSYCAGNNNGTSVEDGQIPEIIFYT